MTKRVDELLTKNLDNIDVEYDLFGNRIDKLAMKDRIGFMPISIWQPNWTVTKELKAVVGDDGQSRADSGKNTTFGANKGSSIFNPHLAQMILSAYCPPGAKIYDPFGGGGTRGFIASAMGHDYSGVELRQEEVDRIIEQQGKLDKHFHIQQGNSMFYPYEDNAFDFSYTCPPYYNLEVYSDKIDDMSNAKTYDDFLCMIEESLKGVHKALKKDAISVWVVGNFRDKKGNLTHFNGDLIRCAKNVGFALHDELVFWGASGSAAQRCGNFEANRKSVRVHEYIIILRRA